MLQKRETFPLAFMPPLPVSPPKSHSGEATSAQAVVTWLTPFMEHSKPAIAYQVLKRTRKQELERAEACGR
jgi:hypothetical protein